MFLQKKIITKNMLRVRPVMDIKNFVFVPYSYPYLEHLKSIANNLDIDNAGSLQLTINCNSNVL